MRPISKLIFLFLIVILPLIFLHSCIEKDDTMLLIEPAEVLELGQGWASNTINTVIFKRHGLVTRNGKQFGGYYADEGDLIIFCRDLKTNKLELNTLDVSVDLFDAHNAISIGIDGLNYLHISYGQHSNSLLYRRSLEPLSIEAWTDEIPMTSQREEYVTYPTFLMPSVEEHGYSEPSLFFLYRNGRSGDGDLCLKEYSASKQTWSDREPCILAGSGLEPWTSSPYWNQPTFDNNGRLHLSFTWRTHSIGEEGILNNINIDYAVSDDLGLSWSTSNGNALLLPITPVNSETVLAVSPGANLINQTGSDVDSHGNLHVVFYSDDEGGIPQYQHLWFDGRQWRQSFISNRLMGFDLTGGGTLQIPMSRPEIVIDEDTVYVIYRGDLTGNRIVVQRLLPPDYESRNDIRILWNDETSYAEPVIDRERWNNERILSMLIQKNHQPDHDEAIIQHPEPVFIVDWEIVSDW
jgi:hypothetical protein